MKRFTLRLPDDLHAALQRSAQNDYRSLHNQILSVLENFVHQSEIKELETILEPPRAVEETEGRLMIMDGEKLLLGLGSSMAIYTQKNLTTKNKNCFLSNS